MFVLYTDESIENPETAKTAHGLLRFRGPDVRAIVDTKCQCALASEIHPDFPAVPIVAAMADAGVAKGDDVVVGFAPVGGRLSSHQRSELMVAHAAGASVINGLHDFLGPGPRIVDLRSLHSSENLIARGRTFTTPTLLTVGTSHSIGKMTATVCVHSALRRRGVRCDWLATGQTGVLIRGTGRVIDSIPIDFVPGHLEAMLADVGAGYDIVLVEGQGSLFHPSYSPTAFALLHTVRPEMVVICHRLGQERFGGFEQRMPSVEHVAKTYEMLGVLLDAPTSLTGVSLDSSRSTEAEYRSERTRLENALAVPCVDPVRETADRLADPIDRLLAARAWS